MAGQSNNVKSTVGSADVSSSASSPEVPATPRRTKGPLRRDSATAPQLSSPTLPIHQSGSSNLQATPTAGQLAAVYETCSPLDHSTRLSSDDIFTPIPLSFGPFSLSPIPDTPLSSRARGLSGVQARSNRLWFEEEDLRTASRTLFVAPSPSMCESAFPSSLASSSDAFELSLVREDDNSSSNSDDDITTVYTATGTPMLRHKCAQDCKQNPWFCPRAPEPQLEN